MNMKRANSSGENLLEQEIFSVINAARSSVPVVFQSNMMQCHSIRLNMIALMDLSCTLSNRETQ